MARLKDPNFQAGAVGWRGVNLAPGVVYGQQNNPAVGRTLIMGPGGAETSYMYARTAQPGGSIALDFDAVPPAGFDLSLVALAWVRSAPGAGDVSGQLVLWHLGSNAPHVGVNFTAGQTWTPITLMAQLSAPYTYRIEFYLDTVNTDLLIDSVDVF